MVFKKMIIVTSVPRVTVCRRSVPNSDTSLSSCFFVVVLVCVFFSSKGN